MKLVKVGAGILNQIPLDWEGNTQRILQALRQARKDGVSILCLPELCITGYGCEDAFQGAHVQDLALRALREIAEQTRGLIVSLGVPVTFRNALFNCACLVADRRILGFTAKKFLAADGLHYEPRWFRAWPEGVRNEVRIEDASYPIGDLHYDCGGIKIGFEICEDAWVARRPGANLAGRGVDLIMNPSASHFAFGKIDVRRRFVVEGSRSFGVTYLYSNLLGNEAGRAIYDGGAIIASGGRLVATGPRFTFREFHVTSAVVDVDATRTQQLCTGSFTPELADGGHGLVSVPFRFPYRDPSRPRSRLPSWEISPYQKQEEFTRAVGLALFDYLRKSRLHGFTVSLSGGADSAAVVCLVALSVRLALGELTLEGFAQRLPHIPSLKEATGAEDLIRRLLTCAYQSTRNSSDATRTAARQLAEEIGARFFELDVDGLVTGYVDLVSGILGRRLDWDTDDVALQNVQARVRGPGIWLLANACHSLLLTTSNRSEAAVGYTTMDGDTCGGLNPIGGIDKAFLRTWLRWMEAEGPEGLEPVRALTKVNRLRPTAELRPPEADQTDEKDLMPYEVLDAIERAAIRDKRSPMEVYRLLRGHFEHSKTDLGAWIERFFLLWCQNQWKRERYAPSFHLDDENLDPKTWCRFPILSGNFRKELLELQSYLQGIPPSDP